jgi:hypothetical protein
VAVSFIGGGKSQVTDKLSHTMLCSSPWSTFKLTTSVVIGTDCIGSCKFNYHTIRATMAPGHIRHVIVKLISNALREINLLKLRSHNSRYYLIVLVTKASITVHLQPIVWFSRCLDFYSFNFFNNKYNWQDSQSVELLDILFSKKEQIFWMNVSQLVLNKVQIFTI